MKDFIKYDRHDEEWEKCLTEKEKNKKAETWMMERR